MITTVITEGGMTLEASVKDLKDPKEWEHFVEMITYYCRQCQMKGDKVHVDLFVPKGDSHDATNSQSQIHH